MTSNTCRKPASPLHTCIHHLHNKPTVGFKENVRTNTPASFEHMLAGWNELDVTRIRGHLDKALSPQILFADPNYLIQGLDAFEQMVIEFREKYPDATCEHTSGMDTHHNRYRYKWLVSVGGKPMVPGIDVAEVSADGKIVRIDGFFGPVPDKNA